MLLVQGTHFENHRSSLSRGKITLKILVVSGFYSFNFKMLHFILSLLLSVVRFLMNMCVSVLSFESVALGVP